LLMVLRVRAVRPDDSIAAARPLVLDEAQRATDWDGRKTG
jgi:hypothetical protein